MGVDLHTDESFCDLGRSVDIAFPKEASYQAAIERWNSVQLCYESNAWASELLHLNRNVVPLASSHVGTFRRYIAELRAARGAFDPAKPAHLCIFLDCLSSLLFLWATLARDARRFYQATMPKDEFEKTLKYYLWGGKESYQIRKQMREKSTTENRSQSAEEFPAWDRLVSFVGLVIAAPQSIFECAHFCREIAFRVACGSNATFDEELARIASSNTRVKQFSSSLSDYILAACGIPKDMGRAAESLILSF